MARPFVGQVDSTAVWGWGLLLGSIALGLVPAAIASTTHRPLLLWWLFGAVLFIPALICAVLIDPAQPRGNWISCPQCRSRASSGSRSCAHCRAAIRGPRFPAPSEDASTSTTTEPSPLEELERYASLHAEGVLSDDEWARLKSKLLD